MKIGVFQTTMFVLRQKLKIWMILSIVVKTFVLYDTKDFTR